MSSSFTSSGSVSPTLNPQNVNQPFVFTVATLQDLQCLPSPRLAPGSVKVEIKLPGIEGVQREQFELRLAHELAACGCREGSIAVLIYLAVVPLLAMFGPFAANSALTWIGIVGGVLVAGMLGKVMGLTLAHVRLRRIVNELESMLIEVRLS